jgi:hypothetical protein
MGLESDIGITLSSILSYPVYFAAGLISKVWFQLIFSLAKYQLLPAALLKAADIT